ncbi:AlpA family phage regulatory protein [Rhodobacteraceae bacterium CH30]|nr:AlpA family phage regulatory protein [Rhodobacteraceae bacterium CH30]
MTDCNPSSENRILRRKQLEEQLGLSCSTIYSKMSVKSKYYDPAFPRPVRLGKGSIGWLDVEVNAYLLMLASKRVYDVDSTC